MTSQYQFDGQNLNHGFLGCCIAGESVCLVIDILYIALQQFEPLHLKGFSVPKIYLLAAKGGQDRRDEFSIIEKSSMKMHCMMQNCLRGW